MNYEHLTDIEKVDLAYKILHSVNDSVIRLWRMAWGLGHKECMSAWEYDNTNVLIEKYGYDLVRVAFQEAAKHGVYNLAYVEKIVNNKSTKENADKEEAEHKKRMAEQKILTQKKLERDKDGWTGFANSIKTNNVS